MQTDSIITNTISEDIRQKGHQSIRFAAGGFSFLVSDASFVPVYLKKFTFSDPPSREIMADECQRILHEQNLLPFYGETVFISDTQAATIVPDPFFDEAGKEALIAAAHEITDDEAILSRKLKNRSEHIVFSFSRHFQKLEAFFTNGIHVLHSGECMISLSDQVSASDHQRGFLLIEIQDMRMEILVIKGDHILLSNRYPLKKAEDYLYYTLNTMKQLGLDRETVPVYYAGCFEAGREPDQLMRKYLRKITPVPYFIEGLEKPQKLEFLLLSESTKCV